MCLCLCACIFEFVCLCLCVLLHHAERAQPLEHFSGEERKKSLVRTQGHELRLHQ